MRKNRTAEIVERFSKKRAVAENESSRKLAEIHDKIPRTAEIDRELGATALNILGISASGENIDDKMASLKEHNAALRRERAEILASAGYPEDYTSVKYDCPKCSDTGFVGISLCSCLRSEIAAAAFEDSGIGALVKTQSFDTFDLKYYSGEDRETMAHNLEVLKGFADNFEPGKPRNYLLIGKTGLGKTHLSTSVAKTVIEKGFRVVYDTISNIISDFEAERFSRTMGSDELRGTYYDCDLLIIDDMGCEVNNAFTVACVYNLINTRVNNNKSTLINTNLDRTKLREIYADRITSRLFGEFIPLQFAGEDIRYQKLNKK